MTALDFIAKHVHPNTILSKDGVYIVKAENDFAVGINPFIRAIEEAYSLGADKALEAADSATWIHGDSISSLKGTIKLDPL